MRNQEFLTKILNIKENMARENFNGRRSAHEKDYQRCIEEIREKSMSIREKIVRMRKFEKSKRNVVVNEGQNIQKARSEFKHLNESLAHETLKLKSELSTIEEMFQLQLERE